MEQTSFTIADLEVEEAELLPARQALGGFNVANILASNTAVALNAGSFRSFAAAAAIQTIVVHQR